MTMAEDYYAKKEARIQRYQDLAERKKVEGNAIIGQAHKMAEAIPFGQPILVGHYSEKRDRNYRDKIHNKFGKGFETLETAEHYKRKADAAIDNDAISSDAPDAIKLLKEKLQSLKESHALMLAGNKIIRNKKLTAEQKIAELVKIGLEEKRATDKLKPDALGDIGFPRYAITNSSANIRNVEKRIEFLEKRANDVTTEITIGDFSIVNSVEDNRIMVFFPFTPDEGIRSFLKARGFRWSPSNRAWQAYRSAAHWIPEIVKRLTVMPAYITPVTNYKQPQDNYNLYLTGYYFNECTFDPTNEEIIHDLFYDGLKDYPADWIAPEMITRQRCTA